VESISQEKGEKMSKIDPEHYKFGGVECIDAIKSSLSPEQFKGYLKASIIKYLWRYEKKNGLEDLEKADWFLRKLRYEVEIVQRKRYKTI